MTFEEIFCFLFSDEARFVEVWVRIFILVNLWSNFFPSFLKARLESDFLSAFLSHPADQPFLEFEYRTFSSLCLRFSSRFPANLAALFSSSGASSIVSGATIFRSEGLMRLSMPMFSSAIKTN